MDPRRPFVCNYCKRNGYVRESGLDSHVSNKHPEFIRHYESAKQEAIRLEKRALDAIPAAQAYTTRAATRNTAQDSEEYYFRMARAQITQSQSRAHEGDNDDPALDLDGQAETYLPHQVKSKTKRTDLGPRRNTGSMRDSLVTVVDPRVWEGDDLEDVPENEKHDFDARHKGFNPFYPFANGSDFKKAQWFIKYRIPDSAITAYFNNGIGTAKSFQSPYVLHRLIDEMEPALAKDAWFKGNATFIADKKNANQPYYFRDLETSIRFLMEQPCFRDYMVYAPCKEYLGNPGDPESQRLFSEAHTGTFWEKEQESLTLGMKDSADDNC